MKCSCEFGMGCSTGCFVETPTLLVIIRKTAQAAIRVVQRHRLPQILHANELPHPARAGGVDPSPPTLVFFVSAFRRALHAGNGEADQQILADAILGTKSGAAREREAEDKPSVGGVGLIRDVGLVCPPSRSADPLQLLLVFVATVRRKVGAGGLPMSRDDALFLGGAT